MIPKAASADQVFSHPWTNPDIALNVLTARDRDLKGETRSYVLIAPVDGLGYDTNPVDNVDVTRAAFIGLDEARLLKAELESLVRDWEQDDPKGERTYFAMTSTSEHEREVLAPHVVVDSPSVRLFANRTGRFQGKPSLLFSFHRERSGGGGYEDHTIQMSERWQVHRFSDLLGVALRDIESDSIPRPLEGDPRRGVNLQK